MDMPDTADHRAEMAVIAMQRDKAGLPRWTQKIDLRGLGTLDRGELETEAEWQTWRDTIVNRIKQSAWYRRYDEFSELHEAVANLADAEDDDEFGGWMDEVYDLADYDRVWIATF